MYNFFEFDQLKTHLIVNFYWHLNEFLRNRKWNHIPLQEYCELKGYLPQRDRERGVHINRIMYALKHSSHSKHILGQVKVTNKQNQPISFPHEVFARILKHMPKTTVRIILVIAWPFPWDPCVRMHR